MKKTNQQNKKGSMLKKMALKLVRSKKQVNSDYQFPYATSYYNSYLNTPGKPVWSGREYVKFSDEGYIKNVIAHRSVSMIASGAASVPWKLNKITGSVKKELSEHPILSLLKKPNPCFGGVEFFEKIYSYMLIGGNAYVQLIKDSSNTPRELFALRPDRVNVIANYDCMPQGYRYQVDDKVKDFKVDRLTGQSDILHLKKFHPLNDWYGLSSIEAAAYSIDQHNEASAWNQALLQNGARPSGALVVKAGENGEGGYLSEEQYIRIKSQVDETHSGSANAGRPLLLEGGLEWKEMSISPKDMDFINTKHSAARDISLAFGVPPQLLGIPGDATYNNMAEARLSLWEQTILPMVDNVTSSLNNWLIPIFGNDLRLSVNLDEVSALAPRREAAWKRVKDADFLSDEEKRKIVGLK